MKRFLFLVLAAIGYFTSAHVAQAQTFTPISPTVPIVAPNGSSSASTAISQAAFGSVIQVYDAASVPITWAVSKTSGEASASSSSTTVAPGATSYFYIGNGISDAAVYGIGGTGTVYIQVGNGGGGGGGGGGLISCSTNQLIYYAATGTTGSCLTLGTNLSITSGTLNATAGGGGVSTFTGDGSLLNNSASTGAVTATLANTGVGYAVWGDISSSSGAPGYHALSSYPAAAFPTLNQSTTGNAATTTALSTTGANGTFWGVSAGTQGWYTPAGSGTVNSGTSGQVGCYAASGTAISGCSLAHGLAISGSTLGISEPVEAPITTSTYTLQTTDCGQQIPLENASGVTVTVPGGSTFDNCQVDFTVPSGYGTSTLTGSSVTLGGHASISAAVDRQCGINFDGTNWQVIGCTALVSGGSGGQTQDIQTFSASGTWTKPAWASSDSTAITKVLCIGGGGGAGSGAVEPSGTAATGGGGGGGASYVAQLFPTSSLSATVTVTIATGGNGGGAVSSVGNGNAGSAGGNTTFGSYLTAYGGSAGGAGGNATSSVGGVGAGPTGNGNQYVFCGAAGGSGSNGGNPPCLFGGSGGGGDGSSGGPGQNGGGSAYGGGGGGAGGGLSAGAATSSGGGSLTNLGVSGVGGGSAGAAGNNGNTPSNAYSAGTGAGGSGSSTSASLAGGAGGLGAGGGGSGAGETGSGAGGAGGSGKCTAITSY